MYKTKHQTFYTNIEVNNKKEYKELPPSGFGGSSLTTEDLLTTEEAASFLKISVGTLRNLTSNGHIPYYKLGRRNRYILDDLRKLILSNKRGNHGH